MRLPEKSGVGRWALGLSGGADSVALLLKCLERGFPVVALHFNHAFEDENGDEAEAFCRALCERQSVPLIVGKRVPNATERGSKEKRAREARMAFFVQAMRAAACGGILLAHQMDDRAENLILRLARGCGSEGLTTFGWSGGVPGAPELRIWRPLLDETHAQQEDWLRRHDQPWVEDVSNADLSIPRNAIRRVLVPLMPHFTTGANAAADLLAEESACLNRLTAAAIVAKSEQSLELHPKTDSVLVRRALRAWLTVTLTRQHLETLATLPLGGITQVTGGLSVKRLSETTWVRLF